MSGRPLSLSYYTVPELAAPEMVRVAAAAGCAHVGLRLLQGQPDGEMLPAMTDPAARRAIRKALEEAGVTVLDANTARLIPDTRIETFEPFLDVAAEFGARHVLATADDPDLSRAAERLHDLCDRASRRGMTVEFEFVPWMPVPGVAAAARLADAVGHPAFGIAVDALHVSRSGSTADDVAALSTGMVRYLHLCDAPASLPKGRDALLAEAVQERLFPGDGALDLVGLLRAAPPGIPLALEVPTRRLAQTVPAAERVRRAVAGARRVLALAFPEREPPVRGSASPSP